MQLIDRHSLCYNLQPVALSIAGVYTIIRKCRCQGREDKPKSFLRQVGEWGMRIFGGKAKRRPPAQKRDQQQQQQQEHPPQQQPSQPETNLPPVTTWQPSIAASTQPTHSQQQATGASATPPITISAETVEESDVEAVLRQIREAIEQAGGKGKDGDAAGSDGDSQREWWTEDQPGMPAAPAAGAAWEDWQEVCYLLPVWQGMLLQGSSLRDGHLLHSAVPQLVCVCLPCSPASICACKGWICPSNRRVKGPCSHVRHIQSCCACDNALVLSCDCQGCTFCLSHACLSSDMALVLCSSLLEQT